MGKANIIIGEFPWEPLERRTDHHGLWVEPSQWPPPPSKSRKPWLWLAQRRDACRENQEELFLVNASGEKLDFVWARTKGLQVSEGKVATGSPVLSKAKERMYKFVSSPCAVKVDAYDSLQDAALLLQIGIRLQSKRFGKLDIFPPPAQGGVDTMALVWSTGEVETGVTVIKNAQ